MSVGDELTRAGYFPLLPQSFNPEMRVATAEILRAVEKLKKAGGVEGLVVMDADTF